MTLPSPILSSVFTDGELTNEVKWYARIFTVINNIISWGQTIAQFLGGGSSSCIGVPPAYTSGLFRTLAASVVVTYVTGGVVIPFSTAFTSGVLTIVVSAGDSNGSLSQLQILNTGTSVSQFKVAGFTPSGAQVANSTIIRINYIAIGW